jgi:hypothetical protein
VINRKTSLKENNGKFDVQISIIIFICHTTKAVTQSSCHCVAEPPVKKMLFTAELVIEIILKV